MKNSDTYIIKMMCFFVIFLLGQSCNYSCDPILKQRKKNQIGKYVIDTDRTEWGEYETEKDNYKDLTIVFNPNMTFEVSQSVPFLLDTTGQYVIRGTGELCDIFFSSQIRKYGITQNGIWLWPCWVEQQDTITAIITPTPQQNENRVIPKLYFRKIGYF